MRVRSNRERQLSTIYYHPVPFSRSEHKEIFWGKKETTFFCPRECGTTYIQSLFLGFHPQNHTRTKKKCKTQNMLVFFSRSRNELMNFPHLVCYQLVAEDDSYIGPAILLALAAPKAQRIEERKLAEHGPFFAPE